MLRVKSQRLFCGFPGFRRVCCGRKNANMPIFAVILYARHPLTIRTQVNSRNSACIISLTAFMALLLRASRPSAVRGIIRTVVVVSFHRVIRTRSWSHILLE